MDLSRTEFRKIWLKLIEVPKEKPFIPGVDNEAIIMDPVVCLKLKLYQNLLKQWKRP